VLRHTEKCHFVALDARLVSLWLGFSQVGIADDYRMLLAYHSVLIPA